MKTSKILTLTVVIVALMATATLAETGRGHKARRAPMALATDADSDARLDRLAEQLDLTDTQKSAIEALRETSREQCRGLRKDLARLQNELQGEMLKDEPSESVVVDLTKRMGAVRTELAVNRAKTRLAVREQLTEEQRDQMMLMDKHGGRGGRRDAGRTQDGGSGAGRCAAPDRNADR